MTLRFIHVVCLYIFGVHLLLCSITINEQITYTPFPVGGHWFCLHFRNIINNAAMNALDHIFVGYNHTFLLVVYV